MSGIAADILAPSPAPVVETVVTPAAEPEAKKPAYTSMTKEERIKAAQAVVDKQKAAPVTTEPAKPAPTEAEKNKALEFGAAARREKEFREKTEKAKAELNQRELKIKEQESTLAELKQALANAKKDPNGWLKVAGLSYDEVTQSVLSGGKLTPEDALKAADDKIEAFKREQQTRMEELVKQEQQSVEEQKQRLRENFHKACNEFPSKAPEQFEYLKQFPGSGEYIHEVIIQDLVANRQTNPNAQPMPLTKAAELVEAWLEKQVEGLSKTKKFQSKLAPKPAEPKPEPEDGKILVREHTRTPKTITSSMTASTVTVDSRKKNLSRQERLDRAVAAVKATKK